MAGLCEGGNEPPGSLKASKTLVQACQNPAHCAVAHIRHLSLCDVQFLFPYLEGVNRLGGERDRAVQTCSSRTTLVSVTQISTGVLIEL
ncbi:hypothetical protein ANN_13998 [Periplaneta americana]|uniref:Uncharacterized protein n=1 Tax=Periplaneta americana TaxID=6978 RepID=A0ABQ8SV31_PERAM|nr:hypothetical protein ANN_13998 [Periplaneta americana]